MTRRTAAIVVRAATIVGLRRWAYRNVYLHCRGWHEMARAVRSSQGGRCASCQRRARLDVHHMHYWMLGRERVGTIYGDVIGLCRTCHQRWDGRR